MVTYLFFCFLNAPPAPKISKKHSEIMIRVIHARKPPPLGDEIFRIQGGGFLDPLSGAQIFGFWSTVWDRFTSRNRCFEGAKTHFFLAAGGGRNFCTFMMVLPIEIAHFELKNSKFSGRRRRPKILTSGADLGDPSSENKGGFRGRGGGVPG